MAQNTTQPGIKNSWSLISFAKTYGKMQVGSFTHTDEETGEIQNFKSCIFTDGDNNRTFVAFSSHLGELTPQQIAAQKNELQVVELESGTFKLCKQGENTWDDVDLSL